MRAFAEHKLDLSDLDEWNDLEAFTGEQDADGEPDGDLREAAPAGLTSLDDPQRLSTDTRRRSNAVRVVASENPMSSGSSNPTVPSSRSAWACRPSSVRAESTHGSSAGGAGVRAGAGCSGACSRGSRPAPSWATFRSISPRSRRLG